MKITSRFGDPRPGLDPNTHQGVDYTNGVGAEVKVNLESGKIIARGDFSYTYRNGKLVKVRDFTLVIEGEKFFHVYAHLKNLFVKVNDLVKIGFLLGYETNHVHRGLFEKRGVWKNITHAEKSGWAIDPWPFLTGEMEKIKKLEKEIQRLADREKELVRWLTDCNAKKDEILGWNKENEEKAVNFEKALKAEKHALSQKVSELEIQISGLKKETEQWKIKFMNVGQSETKLQEAVQKLQAERHLERTQNSQVISDLRNRLQKQESALEELRSKTDRKGVAKLQKKTFYHVVKVLVYIGLSGMIASLITFTQGKEIPAQYAGIAALSNMLLVVVKKYLDERRESNALND